MYETDVNAKHWIFSGCYIFSLKIKRVSEVYLPIKNYWNKSINLSNLKYIVCHVYKQCVSDLSNMKHIVCHVYCLSNNMCQICLPIGRQIDTELQLHIRYSPITYRKHELKNTHIAINWSHMHVRLCIRCFDFKNAWSLILLTSSLFWCK